MYITCLHLHVFVFVFVILVKSSFYFTKQPANLGLKYYVFLLNLNHKLAASIKIVLAVYQCIDKSKRRFKSTHLENRRVDTKTWMCKQAKEL